MTHPIKNSFSTGTLPGYKNPPVNEVVCGMRFHTPDKLLIPHIGFLWNKFRSEYSIIQHAPRIVSIKGEIPVNEIAGLPFPRVWFINKSDDQLVQFQTDRFYFNWRRRQSDYPGYAHIIKNFETVLDNILNLFDEFELGELNPIEYELSYINHIPKGQGWDSINDLPGIFSDFVWRQTPGRFLPNPVNVAWQTEFPLPENKGDLVVNLKQATRTQDKVPLLVLELRARGISESANKKSIREWFDGAHEWIVRGFTDLTTPEIQEIWEREKNA